MRSLDELLVDDMWPTVEGWCRASPWTVEELAADVAAAEATLLALQVTTRSALGAMAFHSGGILVDAGWLRILGAGHPRVGGGLREWNAPLGGLPLDPPLVGALVVAYDVLGGVFALNGGAWDGAQGHAHYLAPDTWDWFPMAMGYGDFLAWALSPRLAHFYEGMRWPGWEAEAEALGPDEVLNLYPPLGTDAPGSAPTPVADRHRGAVPLREQWLFVHDLRARLGGVPAGGQVGFEVTGG